MHMLCVTGDASKWPAMRARQLLVSHTLSFLIPTYIILTFGRLAYIVP